MLKNMLLCLTVSALQAIGGSKSVRPELVHSIYSICNNLIKRSVTVVFDWVPSHIRITGNEIADINAKRSLKEPNINISVNFNYQEIMSLVMSRIIGLWQLGWDNRNRPRHYSITPTVHAPGPVSINKNYTKPITRLRVGVLTGLASTKFKLRQATSPNCVSCVVLEDVKHFLLHCDKIGFTGVNKMILQNEIQNMSVNTNKN